MPVTTCTSEPAGIFTPRISMSFFTVRTVMFTGASQRSVSSTALITSERSFLIISS